MTFERVFVCGGRLVFGLLLLWPAYFGAYSIGIEIAVIAVGSSVRWKLCWLAVEWATATVANDAWAIRLAPVVIIVMLHSCTHSAYLSLPTCR